VWASPARAVAWPFRTRGVEAEIALRLASPVTARQASALDGAAAARLVDAMAVSIEVVDSRWLQGSAAPALLRLADLQSHAALVLGEWQAFRPVEWSAQVCRLRVGTREELRVCGTHSCGDPAWVLADWLRHATREGDLPAGAVVTTGSWVGTVPASAGDRVEAVFDGIGEATLQL
jgi:2-keto-4-pentenoate hydratase